MLFYLLVNTAALTAVYLTTKHSDKPNRRPVHIHLERLQGPFYKLFLIGFY